MENTFLYGAPYDAYLPVLQEPDQQIVWSKVAFFEDTIFLHLQDFVLTEENLKMSTVTAMTTAMAMAMAMVKGEDYNKIWVQAEEEFKKTKKIKGALYLTPCLQKVWISRYDFKYLKKVS